MLKILQDIPYPTSRVVQEKDKGVLLWQISLIPGLIADLLLLSTHGHLKLVDINRTCIIIYLEMVDLTLPGGFTQVQLFQSPKLSKNSVGGTIGRVLLLYL